jgi:DNA mismatch endonuclease (patch repair protein)
LAVRTFLFRQGFRYRIHDTRLPGKPDIVLPKYKTVIFINGCFWHAHQGCKHFTLPKTNRPFWEQKLLRNRERDQYVLASLLQMGYHVLVVWECELSPPARREETLLGLANEIWQAEG